MMLVKGGGRMGDVCVCVHMLDGMNDLTCKAPTLSDFCNDTDNDEDNHKQNEDAYGNDCYNSETPSCKRKSDKLELHRN